MMNKSIDERLVIVDSDNEFSFKKNKSNLNISFNRSAFIFFCFLIIVLLFSIKVFYFASISDKNKSITILNNDFRADIIDRNGEFLAKSVITNNIGIDPKLINNKKKFLLKLRIFFPDKNFSDIEKKISKKKFFYIEKKVSPERFEKVKLLGEKAIRTEKKITRIYPQSNLFSHVIGQIDDDNNGISGLEKSFNNQLKSNKDKLQLTLDTNIQFLIREELIKSQKIFKTYGSAAILMDINNGEIISLVSLPDFDLNKREEIKDLKFINRITKGVYELGSVFKTFTLAAGLQEKAIETDTEFKNLPKSISCAGNPIREYDLNIPSDLTVEEILIRSGNIGSVRIAQKIGEEKFRNFLKQVGIINPIKFDIQEVGQPLNINWGKCKLATAAFGHGITTTPLQLAKGYSIISNGGYYVKPTLIKKKFYQNDRIRVINKNISEQINPILRKIVSTKIGTANLANIEGYDVGGKTGTAQKSINGVYSNEKINTFVSIFPISNPRYTLLVLLDEPKINSEYIYEYKDGTNFKLKGTPRNTAGWTSVEITGKIIEKIGPILATKY